MPNRIFRGPMTQQPTTVNLPVAGAYQPGILVTENGTVLTVATAADDEAELLVLSNVEFADQDIATVYVSGETGVAYRPEPGQVFQVRLAAATYAKGAPLAIGASGFLIAAALGTIVRAFFDGTPGAKSAGDIDDVRWANAFTKA